MTDDEFSKNILAVVKEYVLIAGLMCDILIELKKALLSFDNAKLNTVLDEKLVMNEQVFYVNNTMEQLIIDRYGKFSGETTKQLLSDFPEIKFNFDKLRAVIKSLKDHAFEVRRIICAIEQYHVDLNVALEGAKSKLYKNYAEKG